MQKFEITNAEGGAAFAVQVKPEAEADRLVGKNDDVVVVELAVASNRDAVDEALVNFLSDKLGIRKRKIAIAAGRSVSKMVIVMGLTPLEIEERLFG